jgi:hypothetical protein
MAWNRLVPGEPLVDPALPFNRGRIGFFNTYEQTLENP